MAKLHIERKISVWSIEDIEYDDTKYTEEEFINQFHRVENGYSDGKLEGCLYETYDYEILQYSAEDITPEDNGNEYTLLILDENGEEIYDNNSKIYKGARYKGLV